MVAYDRGGRIWRNHWGSSYNDFGVFYVEYYGYVITLFLQ
jgi:hypothetical protein